MPRPQTQHRQTPPSPAMAPVTRGRRNRANITGENIEPLSPALTSNSLTPIPSSHNHVRFDQDEENTPIAARRGGSEMDEITKEVNGDRSADVNEPNTTENEVLDSQEEEEEEEEEEEDSDDDAPEAVSMGAGKKEAEKREEDAKRVVEAQKEADKKKRKERDIKLKEQKAEAQERKRVRDNKRRKLETAEDEQDAAIKDQLNREATGVSEVAGSVPAPIEVTSKKSKLPLLLPESLLAQVSARPSPPARGSVDDSDSDEMDDDALVRTGNSAGVSARLLKNRRRREQKKKNKILKKGVVNVKVLKDEAASRKSMAPPASKQVAHIKESWLQKHRRGGIERRSVGSGFVKRK